MSEEEQLREERQRRIAELEERLRQRAGGGVKPSVALTAMAVAGVLLWMQRADLAYFFSPRTPLTLGAEGAYRHEALQSNRYVQVHGVPTARGAWSREGETLYVLVGLRDSPLVVRRSPLPNEQWVSGQPPPPPDSTPFAVRGRLLAEEEAPRYREAFSLLRDTGELLPWQGRLYLLLEGERPEVYRGQGVVAGALLGFIALNALLFARGLVARRLLRQSPPPPSD